jgi:hypothetical protein
MDKEPTSLSNLSNDLLFSLAIQLDLHDLLKFCSSSKKINDTVCRKDNVWLYKLDKEFPNWKELKNSVTIKNPITLIPIIESKSVKDIYVTLYYLNIFTLLKEKLKIEDDIFKLNRLSFSDRRLTEIPKEIGILINLQGLYLNNNVLTEIPKEIGKLTNLQDLYITNNQLVQIPEEISQLINLKELSLQNNKLTTIPEEIVKLTKLEYLNVRHNPIKIPEKIRNMKGLMILK